MITEQYYYGFLLHIKKRREPVGFYLPDLDGVALKPKFRKHLKGSPYITTAMFIYAKIKPRRLTQFEHVALAWGGDRRI